MPTGGGIAGSSVGKRKARLCEVACRLASRPKLLEPGEDEPDRGANRLVGAHNHVARGVVFVSHGKVHPKLPTAGLLPDPALKPGADEMQLRLGDGALQTQHQPVVVGAGMVDAL